MDPLTRLIVCLLHPIEFLKALGYFLIIGVLLYFLLGPLLYLMGCGIQIILYLFFHPLEVLGIGFLLCFFIVQIFKYRNKRDSNQQKEIYARPSYNMRNTINDACNKCWKVVEKKLGKEPPAISEKDPMPACPYCGLIMIIRTAQKGQYVGMRFYGCSKYPHCKGIVNIKEELVRNADAGAWLARVTNEDYDLTNQGNGSEDLVDQKTEDDAMADADTLGDWWHEYHDDDEHDSNEE